MVLANIRKTLESSNAGGVQRGLFSGVKKHTYEEYIATAMAYYEGPPSVHLAGIKLKSPTSGGGQVTFAPLPDDRGAGKTMTPTLAPVSSAASDNAAQALAKAGKNNTALYMLLLPALMYYVVPAEYRALAFVAGLVLSVRFLLKQHLGEPKNVTTNVLCEAASGRMVIRFPVDLPKVFNTKMVNFLVSCDLKVFFFCYLYSCCGIWRASEKRPVLMLHSLTLP